LSLQDELPTILRITDTSSHDDATLARPCSPHTPIAQSYPNVIPTHTCPPNPPPSHARESRPTRTEHAPRSESTTQVNPTRTPPPVSIEHDPCSEDTIQDSTSLSTPTDRQPRKRKSRIPIPCKSTPYRRSNPRPQNSPPIAMTRHIRKGDLVSLVFLNLLPEGEINF